MKTKKCTKIVKHFSKFAHPFQHLIVKRFYRQHRRNISPQKQPQELFYKKVHSKDSENLQDNLCRSLFVMKNRNILRTSSNWVDCLFNRIQVILNWNIKLTSSNIVYIYVVISYVMLATSSKIALPHQARNQKFFRAEEVSWN